MNVVSPIAEALRARPRRAWLAGAHNPWGPGATLVDAWALLDLCHRADVLDAVAARIGPDIILWDSELLLDGDPTDDAALWPVEPCEGALALLELEEMRLIGTYGPGEALPSSQGPLLLMRYLPGACRFVRDPEHPAHIAQMEADPLIDRTCRPLWQARGKDRAGNDFVTGFTHSAPRWAKD